MEQKLWVPYSHGLRVDFGNSEMIFVTRLIAQDANRNVVCEDIEGQTEYVFISSFGRKKTKKLFFMFNS